METLKNNILSAIDNINKIILEEDFTAYPDIRDGLLSALDFVLQNDMESAQKYLYSSFRMLREAPPKNSDLGYDTLVKIDNASTLIKSIN